MLDSDEVSVPGLGIFRAEVVPASFSDKGFTVNPPYRKLTFEDKEPDHDIPQTVQGEGLAECVEALKKQLKETRSVELKGLGKLRLTKSDQIFFVQDEDSNIYPDGFGLEAVSLKNKDARSESGMTANKGKRADKKDRRPEGIAPARKLPKWALAALITLGILILAAVTLRLLGTYAPDFIDRLLYSEEELAILKGTL